MMKYEPASEKTVIISKQITRTSVNDENFEIKNTKQKLVILISIELFIMIIYLILQILIFDEIRNDKIISGIFIELFLTVISIIYLIVFIIGIIQYFPKGISIFTWLSLIQLIGGSILLILAIMGIIISLSLIHTIGTNIIIDISFTIIGILIIVLSVFIIFYSLNLMKSIKNMLE